MAMFSILFCRNLLRKWMGMLPCFHWQWNRSVWPSSQEMALWEEQHLFTLSLLTVSYYLHAFLIPCILCIHIVGMWQALPRLVVLAMRHQAPSFLSQALNYEFAPQQHRAASSYSRLLYQQEKGTRLLWFNFLCVLRQSQQFTDSLMF